MTAPTAADRVLAYHQRTKHHLHRYAAGPAHLDWAAQPDPFRHWLATRRYDLPRSAEEIDVPWAELRRPRPAAPFDLVNLGRLLQLSTAITAWKQYGDSRWALRAHPSSGNLHPTETWVVAYWVDGLADGLYHYQARDHGVEWRASTLASADQAGLWLGFSSIVWREAWKYGERAFRYCQLDMGHVLAAVAYAAALLGWQPRLANLGHDAVSHCLGLDRQDDFAGVEREEAEVLVAMHADANGPLPPMEWDEWSGLPSLLDPHPEHDWPALAEVAEASRDTAADRPSPTTTNLGGATAAAEPVAGHSPRATQVILGRRSAQAFDGRSTMPQTVFGRLLSALLPGGSPVWAMWDRPPRVHPVLFVHRVEGLAPGLYFLPRSEAGLTGLTEAMRREFEWAATDATLPLYRLVAAQAERSARTVSCHQDIAAQCAVAFMLVSEFSGPIRQQPSAWRHLHWEAGMLGHCLSLEAEATGWRGTGIGCYFDDADHEILGLADDRYQVLYHFAVGKAVDDPRLTTLPAYS